MLLLAALVLLPMFRLLMTSLTGDAGQLVAGALSPALRRPGVREAVADHAVDVRGGRRAVRHRGRTDGAGSCRAPILPGKRLLRALILASFVTPPFLGAFAWVLLGGPNAGLINQWYYALFGLKPFEATPLINIFSAGGMVFVMALYTFPYVFTFVANSLDVIPGELEEASAILGAPAWRTALDITLPLVVPALLAGFLIAFLQSMTLFGTPAILALPAGIDTMTTKIWSLFQFPPQLGLAAAVSLPLLLITVALLRAQSAIMGRRGYSVIGGKSSGTRLHPPWRMDDPGAGVVCVRPRRLDRAAVWRAGAHGVREELVRSRRRQSSLEHWRFVFFEFSQTRLAFENTFRARDRGGDRGHGAGDDRRLFEPAQAGLGTSLSRFPRHGAGRHSRHRARRRPLPHLHATAFRAVRNPGDHLPRLPHEGASGRLSADRRIAQGGASRARGREPHLWRDAAARAVRYHDAADTGTA